MIVYHGSKDIVMNPEIRTAKYYKDFYFGFYCTQYQSQAERWAMRYTGEGIVNEYEYTPNSSLSVKAFSEMTEE